MQRIGINGSQLLSRPRLLRSFSAGQEEEQVEISNTFAALESLDEELS
jgi:hypothetical protein